MCVKFIIILCSILSGYASSAATFDQRQTGDLNVQVDLKDLQIIALMKGSKEEYVDYDYAYDYSEMTIKPQNGTTPKPLNVTSTTTDTSNDTTSATAVPTEQTLLPTTAQHNNSQSMETLVTTVITAINDSTTTIKSMDIVTTEAIESLDSTNNRTETSTSASMNTMNCKKGFVRNHKGECELKLHSSGNTLLKLVKQFQKLKLRRENRRNVNGAK